MNMKKATFALAAALALASTSVFAAPASPAEPIGTHPVAGEVIPAVPIHKHDNPHPDHPAKHKPGPRAEGFIQELSLNKDQRRVLHQTMREDMGQQRLIVSRYLEKLPQAEREALAADLRASHDQQFAKFLAVLTPEQKVKALEGFKKFSHGPAHDRGVPPARADVPVAVQLPANLPAPAQLPPNMPVTQ
ncbi:hypothetical protein RBE51_22145 [Pseudomonas taiwanensis]|uniref:hypothetical protein n=1 Tax=Pseudomonas taiwanensis TaxID=470150 RepID=UPI0028DFC6FD|nr:hypothetical protein [Pseudomonas taiwanensis]MDT8925489.1 hypothetical protein [Pseudomonas taiwanensis]